MKKAIIIIGPPGAGKGTQAELVAKKFDLIHIDTGKLLENLFYFSDGITDSEVEKEKEKFKEGELNSPPFVLKKVKEKVESIAKSDLGIVFSGSPRTEYEAFGDDKTEGLISFLEKMYGKENILVFYLDVPEEVSTKRNTSRLVCSECGMPIMDGACDGKLNFCPFCGGKLRKRVLDNPEAMKVRIEEFKNKTKPILNKLENIGYNIIKIDGTPKPYKVFESIKSHIIK